MQGVIAVQDVVALGGGIGMGMMISRLARRSSGRVAELEHARAISNIAAAAAAAAQRPGPAASAGPAAGPAVPDSCRETVAARAEAFGWLRSTTGSLPSSVIDRMVAHRGFHWTR